MYVNIASPLNQTQLLKIHAKQQHDKVRTSLVTPVEATRQAQVE